MLQPSEFITSWGEELVRLTPDSVTGINLPEETLRFLVEAGLPRDCAPCLSFDRLARGLKNIADTYFLHDKAKAAPYLEALLIIGSDGSGNPICFDIAQDGRIVLADHENRFRSMEYVNASVAQLAECLLAYRDMVEASLAENGEDAFLNGNIPASAIEQARARISSADAEALQEGSYWWLELNSSGQQV